jgi:hypothetical protein
MGMWQSMPCTHQAPGAPSTRRTGQRTHRATGVWGVGAPGGAGTLVCFGCYAVFKVQRNANGMRMNRDRYGRPMVSDRPPWLPVVGQTGMNCTDVLPVVKGFG